MDKSHSFIIGEYSTVCAHGSHDPPFGPAGGKDGELRRCPKCMKWWYKHPDYNYIWNPVDFLDFKRRRAIRRFERRERNQMYTLIGSDKIVEDD